MMVRMTVRRRTKGWVLAGITLAALGAVTSWASTETVRDGTVTVAGWDRGGDLILAGTAVAGVALWLRRAGLARVRSGSRAAA
jgi:hypothetical protein